MCQFILALVVYYFVRIINQLVKYYHSICEDVALEFFGAGGAELGVDGGLAGGGGGGVGCGTAGGGGGSACTSPAKTPTKQIMTNLLSKNWHLYKKDKWLQNEDGKTWKRKFY